MFTFIIFIFLSRSTLQIGAEVVGRNHIQVRRARIAFKFDAGPVEA